MSELELICQKPDWRQVGSLLARRFARPVALRITWLIAAWPISANVVTFVAFAIGIAASIALGWPSPGMFVTGAVLLQVWYLVDHVDGQIARLRKNESVTGIYFDFMMHHAIHFCAAFALGYCQAALTGTLVWTLAGAGFAFGSLFLSLTNDCRYKAYYAALIQMRTQGESSQLARRAADATQECLPMGDWAVRGTQLPVQRAAESILSGPVHRSANFVPESLIACAGWIARIARLSHRLGLRSCEFPTVICVLSIGAVVTAVDATAGERMMRLYLGCMALLAPILSLARLTRQVWQRELDRGLGQFLDILGITQSIRSERPSQASVRRGHELYSD